MKPGSAPKSAAPPVVIEVTFDIDPSVPVEEVRIKVIYIVPR